MTDREKKDGRVTEGAPADTLTCHIWQLLCIQLHYFEEKRDWLQCSKSPSTGSKLDLVTRSLVGILSIPSLALLFRHIWAVVYVWTSSEKVTVIFFCTFAGVLVIRPDSGNPPDVVVKVLNILGKWAYVPNAFGWSSFIYLKKLI